MISHCCKISDYEKSGNLNDDDDDNCDVVNDDDIDDKVVQSDLQ